MLLLNLELDGIECNLKYNAVHVFGLHTTTTLPQIYAPFSPVSW